MTSFLNYVTATLMALFAWRGSYYVLTSYVSLNDYLEVCLTQLVLIVKFVSALTLVAKSRKYQGVFEVKSRVKTWQVRRIWSQQLEHKKVPQWGRNQVSGGRNQVSVPCWHATPVANANEYIRLGPSKQSY